MSDSRTMSLKLKDFAVLYGNLRHLQGSLSSVASSLKSDDPNKAILTNAVDWLNKTSDEMTRGFE